MNYFTESPPPSKYNTLPIYQLKNYFFITVCILFINAPAAGSSIKNTSLLPEPIHWTGLYAGGALGALWGQNNATWNPLPSPASFEANQVRGQNNSSSFVGGVLAGYNYRFNKNLISGIEGDWTWANADGALLSTPWIYGTTALSPGSYTAMRSILHWNPSLRARVGYLALPKIMIYGTAGVTWANINYTAQSTNNTNNSLAYVTNANFSKNSLGYAVGGGLECSIQKNILLRTEYLYYQFSNAQNIVVQDSTGNNLNYPSNYIWGNMSANAVRAGLVYKYNNA